MPLLKGNRDQGGYVRITQYPYFLREGCTSKNSDQIMKMALYPGGGVEIVQGVLDVDIIRASGYPFTSWGGAADIGCRINAYNYSDNTNAASGGIQALRVYARQSSGGTICNMYGMECSLDERGSGGSPTVKVAISLLASLRINGVCNTNAHVAVFQDNSQGTISVSTCTGAALVKFQSTQPVASGIRPTCLHFETTGSGTGWTHAFSFQTAAGKEGFTAIGGGALKGNVDGYIKVYDVATGATLYINCYDTVPS